MRRLLLASIAVAAVVLIVALSPRPEGTSTVLDDSEDPGALTMTGQLTELPSSPGPPATPDPAYRPSGANALVAGEIVSEIGRRETSVMGTAAANSGPRQMPPEETKDVPEEDGTAPVFATSRDGIREAMGYIKYDITECFAEWLKLGNPIAGRIKVQFNIARNEDGGADTQEVKIADSTLQHTALEGCVGNAVTTLRFEAPSETMAVEYPFVFSADKSGAHGR